MVVFVCKHSAGLIVIENISKWIKPNVNASANTDQMISNGRRSVYASCRCIKRSPCVTDGTMFMTG